jgi:FlaA1/EpsC-like NDP-sugar epimerase
MLNPRTLLAIAHDCGVSIIAWLLAYNLRFNFVVPVEFQAYAWESLVWVVPLQMLLFWQFGLYRGIWRFASLTDLRRIVFAVGLSTLLIGLMLLMFKPAFVVPRSVLILDPILLVFMMGGSRLAYRAWKEHRMSLGLMSDRRPVLVLGAGSAAEALLRELAKSREWRVVGLLDDAPRKQGRDIHGAPVLGPLDSLPHHAASLEVRHAVIAMPGASHAVRRRASQLCSDAGIEALTVPALEDMVDGKVSVSSLRKIELDDLLGRDPVQLDEAGLHQLLTGKTVLVTGAGGSIGSELCRQIARFEPSRLVMMEQSEFSLYSMGEEFEHQHPKLPVSYLAGDVKDAAYVDSVFEKFRPAVIFHAAAYKHVPLMENINAWQAARNNVLGTITVAKAALQSGAEKFVLISTDKAVNPTNVMGATKRLAEMMCQSLQLPHGTRFISVRFGNVLGSSGSVIPKFRQQIEAGGPVTVTHPDITRYFMSIPEACQLVMQAGLMGRGGEIFVLDMGEPVKIADLARDMIRLSGYGEEDIRIVYSGLRPGEKLYEELLADTETTLPTPHPKLRIAKAREARPAWLEECMAWFEQYDVLDEQQVKQQLKVWVPEYQPG